jgi:hypothetical protein
MLVPSVQAVHIDPRALFEMDVASAAAVGAFATFRLPFGIQVVLNTANVAPKPPPPPGFQSMRPNFQRKTGRMH